MAKKYKVTPTEEEQAHLYEIMKKGKHGAQKRKRAQALLLANEGYTDEAIAERVGMHYRGIEGLRQRFFETALEGKPRGHRPRALKKTNLNSGKTRNGVYFWSIMRSFL
jgi:hypothetical protein